MSNFFPVIFDSISVLLSSEPVLYIVSIMGLAMILHSIRMLAAG